MLSAAMAEGRVNTAQARAIVAALDRLPTTGEFAVSTEQRLAAETHLVALAEHHDAKALRILGGRIFEVIAPDLAEKFDGKALEAEEARALRRTTFTMWEDDEGTCHGRFRIPARHGQMLTKMILAISSPSRSTNDTASSGIDPDLPIPVRHGLALTQLIETYPAEAAQDRRLLSHGRGHHDPRTAPGRPRPRRRVHPGHRRHGSPRPKPDVSRAPPGSSPSSSAGRARSSTSAANADSTPRPCASPWVCATAAAPQRAAKHRPASATPTTTRHGQKAAAPTSRTAASSAPTTTAASTTPSTRHSTYLAEKSASIGARRPALRGER